MKNIYILITTVLLVLLMAGCEREPINEQTLQTSEVKLKSASTVYGFHVSNGRLLDANGNDFIIRGVNHVNTWNGGKQKLATAIPAIAATNSNTVRITVDETVSKDDLKNIINLCAQYKLIVVLEFHPKQDPKDHDKDMIRAVNYWRSMTNTLIGTESIVIINLINEWGSANLNSFTKDYQNIIRILREMSIKNTFMIDANGAGQDYKTIATNGRQIYESDPQRNTMFSVHIYGNYGGSDASVDAVFSSLNSTGLAYCIGEFSWTGNPASNGYKKERIVSNCETFQIGWMAWSWSGNTDPATGKGSVDFMDMDKSANWDGTALTPWGDWVIAALNGKRCSIFGDYSLKAHNIKSFGPLNIDLAFVNDYALYATNTLDIGDGVKLYNNYATDFASVCAGPPTISAGYIGYLVMGCAVQVKDIVCATNKNLWCRNYVNSTGNIYVREGFEGSLQQPYKGTMLLYLSKRTTEMNAPTISTNNSLFYTSATDIIKNAGSGNIPPISPGKYGDFSIGSNNSVTFTAGTYYFKSFNVEPDVELIFPDGEPVIIFVKNQMSVKSRVKVLNIIIGAKAGANPSEILFVVGNIENSTMYIAPNVNWRGTIIAPNAQLNMDSSTENTSSAVLSTVMDPFKFMTLSPYGEAYGALWAKTIGIHQRTSFYFIPFNWGSINPF